MTAATAIELTLFGPPQLRTGGQVLHVGSRKALALLALLALDGAAAREPLAGRLWPDLEPEAARRNLRKELHRLRRVGVALTESGDGILAMAANVQVDLLQFRAAMARADTVQALGLARPSAFDGLDGVAGEALDDWLLRWRQQLRLDRQQARSRCALELQRGGDTDGALALYLQALAEDRCDESAARAAMRLLATRGERSAALALHARLVQALRDDLHIEPDAATTALAAELRQGDGAVAARPAAAEGPRPMSATAPSLLSAKPPFVARPSQQAQIEAAWRGGQRVYLSGEPGAGKTRLACECAAAKGPWFRVACAPNDLELPYATAVRALRGLRETASDMPWPDWVCRELSQLLPELGPAPKPLATDEARARLVAAFAAAWSLGVRDNFQVVLLDDWHWCDAASIELFDAAGDAGVAWLVAYRSAQLPAAALLRMRADVDQRRAVAVPVPGMVPAEVLALVRLLSRSPGGALFAQRLQAATDGNPFFVLETLRALFEQGLLSVDAGGGWRTPFDEQTQDYTELPIPPSVREAVLGRVRALGTPAHRLLEAASLLGDRFEPALLQRALGHPVADGVALLEHATAARLVEPDGGDYRFAHDLVRQCLASSLSLARRRRIHAALAHALAAAGAPPGLVAAQFEGAGQAADAVPWRVAAAQAAQRVHAHADALSQYQQALADGAPAAQAVAIHLAMADAHKVRGDAAAVEAALAAAIQSAAGADPSTRLGAQLARADHWCKSDRIDDGLALLDALAADLALASPAQQSRALDARALALMRCGQPQNAAALHEQAIALLAGMPGHAAQLADLLASSARPAVWRGDLDNALRWSRQAVSVYRAIDDPGGLAQALIIHGIALLLAHNDSAAAMAAFDEARALAAACGHVPAHRGAILNLVKLHADRGDAESALALLDEGVDLAPGFEHARAEIGFMDARYFVHYLRGDLVRAREAAVRLVDTAARSQHPLLTIGSSTMVVDLYLHCGDLPAARALIERCDAIVREMNDPAADHLYGATLRAKKAWLLLAEGRPREAQAVLGEAVPTSKFEDRYLLAWVGAAAALALGDVQGAAGLLEPADIELDAPTDVLANVLVQRLAVARAGGRPDAAARQRAQGLLDGGRVPPLEAQALRRALSVPTGP